MDFEPVANLTNETIDLPWYRYNVETGWIVAVAYTLIFIVGLIGNVLVVLAVLCDGRTMSNCVTIIFLVNLALADLLVIIACLPFTLVAHLIYRKSLY